MQERGTVAPLRDRQDRAAGPAPRRPRRRVWAALGVAAAVVAVDQITKSLAVSNLAGHSVHVIGPLDLELARNTGASFSILTGHPELFVLVALVLVGVLVALVWRATTAGRAVALGLVIGGALGNVVDRIARSGHGSVVDFIALHFWPTFNVADSCIVVGCAALVVSLLRAGMRGRPAAGGSGDAGRDGAPPP